MQNSALGAALDAASRHRRLVLASTAAAIAFGLWALWTIPLSYDVALMLPVEPEVQRSMTFLRESNLSDKVVLSLEIEPSAGGLDALLDASAKLEASLEPPLVSRVESGVSGATLAKEIQRLVARTPELASPADLQGIDRQLTSDGMSQVLRENFRQLVGPGELFTKERIRLDPLGLSRRSLGVAERLSSMVGYEVEIEQGHFVSRDRRHALLILETPIRITDSAGGRELVEYLRRSFAVLPEGVTADIVAGHLHTISNEDVIEFDLIVGLGVAGVGFLALFLTLYPDPRAISIFLLPVASVVIAIGLTGMVSGGLSAFVVGMGGVVAGIADDYGIHVYMTIRASGGDVRSVRLVAGPILTAAVTTLSVFLAFLFSDVSGYQQLALFSITSIAICVLASLFVLPLIVGGRGGSPLDRRVLPSVPRFSRIGGSIAITVWVAIMLAGICTLGDLEIRTDLLQFDGSESYVLEAEQRFDRIWGGSGPPAILVASGKSLDEALHQNSILYQEVVAAMGPDQFGSIAPIFPSPDDRARNLARWKVFWEDGRESRLRALLAEIAPKYGFASTAFEPFLGRLSQAAPEDQLESAALPMLIERFTRQTPDGFHVFSFFPDDERWVAAVRAIAARQPDAFVVSRSGLASSLAASVSSEVRFIATVAFLLIPSLAYLLLRSVRLTVLSLVPVVSSLMAVVALSTAFGWSLTAPAMIAGMVVAGLSIDYGIFIVHASVRGLHTGTTSAVTVSAASTLIGTGALMLSRHPVLFSIGLTMVTGLTAGYASAVLVLPALYDRVMGTGSR